MEVGGGVIPGFSSYLFSWVNVSLHTLNFLSNLPGSALKVCVMVGGGGGGWVRK